MDTQNDDIKGAGSDNRPPMLDKSDYKSWARRIRYYCEGKDDGEEILQSIDHGPFQVAQDFCPPLGDNTFGEPRLQTLSDLTQAEKIRKKADIRAINILLQGLPKDIFTLINHYSTAKDIWDNVQMLLEGSELTKEDRESQLYDEFEHFHMKQGEPLHEYFVRFSKLVNEMRNIKMTMPTIFN